MAARDTLHVKRAPAPSRMSTAIRQQDGSAVQRQPITAALVVMNAAQRPVWIKDAKDTRDAGRAAVSEHTSYKQMYAPGGMARARRVCDRIL